MKQRGGYKLKNLFTYNNDELAHQTAYEKLYVRTYVTHENMMFLVQYTTMLYVRTCVTHDSMTFLFVQTYVIHENV